MRLVGILAVAACVNLSGCWFVFIPGSLMQQASDSITGATGEHCVARHVKVGDQMQVPGGKVGTVKSLSGTSSRCQDPNLPIRAAIEVS